MKKRKNNEKTREAWRARADLMVSCVMCLGGGVLLATIFMHMLPEVREVFAEIEKTGLLPEMNLPKSELFLCIGFFIVFFIEEVARSCMGRSQKRKLTKKPHAAADTESAEHDSQNGLGHDEKVEVVSNHAHDHGVNMNTNTFRAYLVVLALSVHSVFEGFAVAFEDTPRDVWVFFAAILAHKVVVCFCVGEQLVSTKRSICFVIFNMCILAFSTPLGVLIGILISNNNQPNNLLATGILQALAAGVILYVIFFELLGPEHHNRSHGVIKFFAVLIGFAIMLGISLTGGHHAHAHGDHSESVGAHSEGSHHPHGGHHPGHDAHHDDSQPMQEDLARRVEEATHTHQGSVQSNRSNQDGTEHHGGHQHQQQREHAGHENHDTSYRVINGDEGSNQESGGEIKTVDIRQIPGQTVGQGADRSQNGDYHHHGDGDDHRSHGGHDHEQSHKQKQVHKDPSHEVVSHQHGESGHHEGETFKDSNDGRGLEAKKHHDSVHRHGGNDYEREVNHHNVSGEQRRHEDHQHHADAHGHQEAPDDHLLREARHRGAEADHHDHGHDDHSQDALASGPDPHAHVNDPAKHGHGQVELAPSNHTVPARSPSDRIVGDVTDGEITLEGSG